VPQPSRLSLECTCIDTVQIINLQISDETMFERLMVDRLMFSIAYEVPWVL